MSNILTQDCKLEILSPTGGEKWNIGSKHLIKWKNEEDQKFVTARYSVDNGKTWMTICNEVTDRDDFLWEVPNQISKQCKMKIVNRINGDSCENNLNFEITPSQEIKTYKWKNITMNAAFAPRDGAGAIVYKDKMWLIGGWNPQDKVNFPKICNNEVWSSTNGKNWSLEKPNTFGAGFDESKDWIGRHTAGYCNFKDKMWILGGDVNQGVYQPDIWNSINGKNWDKVNDNAPWGERALHHTIVFKDKIWVMGGQTVPEAASAEEMFYNDIWVSGNGKDWHEVKVEGKIFPQRGMIGGSIVFDNKMWILGGGTYDTVEHPIRKFYNDVWCSSDGKDWTLIEENAPWAPRQYHDVAVFDKRMWVMEGYSFENHVKGNAKDVWYSKDGINWYELHGTPWKPRHAASVFVFDNALWMVTGNNMESDVWKLEAGN